MDGLSKIIVNYLKNLFKKFQSVFKYIQDQEISKTNNLIELLFRITSFEEIKRIYRIYKRVRNKMGLSNVRWFERNTLTNYLAEL